MEMSFLHPAGQAEPAEPGPSYKEDQVWKDIETETGFASCADYMEFYEDIRPDFRDRLHQFRRLPGEREMSNTKTHIQPTPEIAIYDLSKQNNTRRCLSLRKTCLSGTELIRALRDPPANSCRQLVLWTFDSLSGMMLTQEMADALILGLKLDPQLLEDLHTLPKHQRYYRTDGFRTSHIKRLLGHRTIAALSQNFIISSTKAVPVLLVAAPSSFYGPYSNMSAMDFTGGGRWKPPFFRSVSDNKVLTGAQPYGKAVEEFIAQTRLTIPTEAVLLLAAVSPLLYNEANQVQNAFMKVQSTYCELIRRKDEPSLSGMGHKDLAGDLDIQRLALRHTLEKGETYVRQAFRYLCSDIDVDWSKEPSYVSIVADWRSLIEEARRLETEVRDYMQIQVGNLSLVASQTSLEESRRSIELSNLQIRESQSGKSDSKRLQTNANIL